MLLGFKTFKLIIIKNLFFLIILFLIVNKTFSHDCISMDSVKSIIESNIKKPIVTIDNTITLEEAYCGQEKLNFLLKKKYNDLIGYKVGFTGKALQERFNINTPATGFIYKHMFVKNNANIKHDFAFRPFIEPDFLVVVKSSHIMKAKTQLEIIKNLKSIHPFIEIPALRFEKDKNVNGNMLVAANMLATYMVMGKGIPIENSHNFIEKLANIETIFLDQNNNVIQKANTRNLMGNPINILTWLINDFNKRGIVLKKDDRISLGAVGKLYPLKKNTQYTYKFLGFDSDVSVKININ